MQEETQRGPLTHMIYAPNVERLTEVLQACCTLQVVFAIQLVKYDGDSGQHPRFRVLIFAQPGVNDV